MATKSKVRVGIEVGGKPRELFSIREQISNRDLFIIMKTGPFQMDNPLGPFSKSTEKRITIHNPTRQNPTNTIKMHTKTDKYYLKDYHLSQAISRGRFDLVYVKISQNLSGDHYGFSSHQRDLVYMIPELSVDTETLLYCIGIGPAGSTPVLDIPYTIFEFSKFSVLFVAAIADHRSPDIGQDGIIITQHPKFNDEDAKMSSGTKMKNRISLGLDDETLGEYVNELMHTHEKMLPLLTRLPRNSKSPRTDSVEKRPLRFVRTKQIR